MYKTNDYLVYKKDVCKVKDIKKNKLNGLDYYILVPIDDDSLIIDVPTDNRMGYIKDIITKEEAEKLINSIPQIEPLSNIEDKNIENRYKNLIYNGTREDLIRIIKTTYLRNEERIKNKKRISDKDFNYFNKAEKYLYNELSIALNMSFDETKDYIISKVKELTK
ncbi:MAG: hypothetical protein IKF19_05460 [Bacilli bacterium]|nr:hypothetical protein [Bacilli bacterium]